MSIEAAGSMDAPGTAPRRTSSTAGSGKDEGSVTRSSAADRGSGGGLRPHAAPRRARSRGTRPTPLARAHSRSLVRSCAHPLPIDLALQLHDAVDERLGSRWATWHEDVDRHDLVAALHDGIVVEHAAATGARA